MQEPVLQGAGFGAGHGGVSDPSIAAVSWHDNMMIAGSQALLLALWRDHARILENLRARGNRVRAIGERAW